MKRGEICQEIVIRYLQGEEEALNELVKNLEGMIISIIKPYSTKVAFEELYQVGWVTVMRCLQGYKVNSGVLFTSYAYTAIKREIRSYVKKELKHASKYDDDGNCIHSVISLNAMIQERIVGTVITMEEIIADNSIDVEKDVIIKYSIPIIKSIVNKIPNEKQKMIILLYLKGDKQNKIAEFMEVTPGYVSRVVKAFNEKCQLELNK